MACQFSSELKAKMEKAGGRGKGKRGERRASGATPFVLEFIQKVILEVHCICKGN